MKNSALIIVDYSNDFVADNGKLTCGEAGQQIENYIVERIEAYNNKKQQIFFMMDLHYEDNHYHPESKLFPPHNILGTIGRELYGKVNDIYQNILFNEHVHFLDKTRYDSFFGTPLDIMLRERGVTQLEIVGVCTDICVLHTAISAYNLGYELFISHKGVASFNPTGHEWALTHFKNSLGAVVE
ncbi:cysteine hydrolase family protein [Staphylococcus gallinarum]|jgi:nicotinamidase-related amidase|uniref:Cysteine hydrolase family protein n=2 Tax=Staphylococcus gallinarum TaxID=1293 RepID=A0A0D0RMC6_STAGA|nr:cysteine hydrolase family protein [Staphylococcus gallinarum]KIR11087.1 isochorismatase [Staphylococcus gallinarum]MBU7217470.1 cysteine hydrolase family protein [Staphylococcus gallinarum]MCD8787034.1 cysteine hydrolase family protein [Staphylococcus gallinarum]MCD8794154.1 cysteine hydrolase family protein [Staphylococcus gallinarum]MCD8822046.1 cysteine hydrolase family protein [Staphylococcus gallinarum]